MLVLALLLALTSPSLSVSPRFAAEPATLVYNVSNIAGPVVCVELVGKQYYTASCRETTNKKERFELKHVPADTYITRAIVCASDSMKECKNSPTLEVIITGVGE